MPWWKIIVVLFYQIPVFFTRVFIAIILHALEDFDIGRELYYLKNICRDRNEVKNNPAFIINIIKNDTDILPRNAKNVTIRLHKPNESSIADPDKYLHIFIFTLMWEEQKQLQNKKSHYVKQSMNICCKTSKFRGPRITQLYLAGIGFVSRESAFYNHFVPELLLQGVKVPRCYFSNVSPLLTHSFFLLEAINIDGFQNTPLRDTTLNQLDIELFIREEARLHAFYTHNYNEDKFQVLSGSIFPAIIKTSKPLSKHKKLLEVCFDYVLKKSQQSLLHGDARLGNSILHKDIQRVTLVDFEMCQPGAPLFDVLYCLWLCTDTPPAIDSDDDDDDGNGYTSYSKNDWKFINIWKEQMDLELEKLVANNNNNNHVNIHNEREYAPLDEQVLVVSILLWAYVWAVGQAGFGKVWQDGNNEEDLKAWSTRVRRRIQNFAKNRQAHNKLSNILSKYSLDGTCLVESNKLDLIANEKYWYEQIQSFINIGIHQKVWTETDDDNKKVK